MSVKMALLSLVADGPRYGYQLRNEFEEHTGGAWPLNVGQVYTTLARLTRDGLVDVDGTTDGDDTRTYAATASGRAAVAGWFATPVARGDAPPREELAIKVAVALRAPQVSVEDVIQRQRRETLRGLQQLTRVKAAIAEGDLANRLLAESQIFAVEAEARWLDLAEAMIHRVRSAPPPALPAAPPGPAPGVTAGSPPAPEPPEPTPTSSEPAERVRRRPLRIPRSKV